MSWTDGEATGEEANRAMRYAVMILAATAAAVFTYLGYYAPGFFLGCLIAIFIALRRRRRAL